jgi:hypothetical protein
VNGGTASEERTKRAAQQLDAASLRFDTAMTPLASSVCAFLAHLPAPLAPCFCPRRTPLYNIMS